MKKNQKEEIRNKTMVELSKEAMAKETEIVKLKMEIRMAKAKNTSAVKRMLDELAFIKTVMNEKRFLELTKGESK